MPSSHSHSGYECGELTELADIGVIEFAGGGPGRAKQPMLAYDGLEIDIPFDRASASVETSAP